MDCLCWSVPSCSQPMHYCNNRILAWISCWSDTTCQLDVDGACATTCCVCCFCTNWLGWCHAARREIMFKPLIFFKNLGMHELNFCPTIVTEQCNMALTFFFQWIDWFCQANANYLLKVTTLNMMIVVCLYIYIYVDCCLFCVCV